MKKKPYNPFKYSDIIPNPNIQHRHSIDIFNYNKLPNIQEKFFTEFLDPTLVDFSKDTTEHKNYIDFYTLNKHSIKVIVSENMNQPNIMQNSYSYFFEDICKMNFVDKTDPNKEGNKKIIFFEQQNKPLYVIIRTWHKYKINQKDSQAQRKMESFIRNNYNKYGNMNLISESPCGLKPVIFNIIHLSKIDYFVTELLMPYGGKPLRSQFQNLEPKQIIEIFIEIVEGLKNLDVCKILPNQINADNILLDFIGKQPKIKFVNFGIDDHGNLNSVYSPFFSPKKLDPIFFPPETFLRSSVKEETNHLDSWKSQIYSLGVLILHLFKFFPNYMELEKFDTFKKSLESYKGFMNHLKSFVQTIQDQNSQNLMNIVKNCLIFDQESRLTLNEIIGLIPNITSQNAKAFENEIQNRLDFRQLIQGEKKIQFDMGLNYQNQPKNQKEGVLQKGLQADFRALQVENMGLKKEITNQKEQLNTLNLELTDKKEDLDQIITEFTSCKKELDKKFDQIVNEKEFVLNSFIEFSKGLFKHLQKLDIKMQKFYNPNQGSEIISGEKINLILALLESKFSDIEYSNQKLASKIIEFREKIKHENIIHIEDCNNIIDICEKLYTQIKLNKGGSNPLPPFQIGKKMNLNPNVDNFGELNHNKKPDGVGELCFKNSKIRFIGEFKDGIIKHDVGFAITEDSTYYFGNIKEGTNNNSPILMYGKFPEFKGRDYYIGDIQNFKKHGKGKYVKENGESYEGEFVNDKKHGYGIITYKDHKTYEGQWQEDKYEGKGKIGSSELNYYYEGDFHHNDFHGEGIRYYPTGDVYEGTFEKGRKHGTGKLTFGPNTNFAGEYYYGQFVDNDMRGEGTYFYPNGSYFKGNFINYKKEGKGTFFSFKNGQIVEIQNGTWSGDLKHGKFCLTKPNRPSEYAEFKDNVRIDNE